jgi:hypothetical protein
MKRILITLAVCALMAAPAMAIPSITPGYITDGSMLWSRGAAGSTWQEWTFNDNDNPANPDQFVNPYGTPQATMSSSDPLSIGWMSANAGRSGVWVGEPLKTILVIPNNPSPNEYKDIWLEMDFTWLTQGPVTATPIPVSGSVVTLLYNIVDLPPEGLNQWRRLTANWRIYPNPEAERICIEVYGTGGKIDYAVVDTICSTTIPAPGAILLGSIGVAFVGWLRRRRTL